MRTTERRRAIKRLDVSDLPDIVMTANNIPAARQNLTYDNLARVVERLGFTLRFNVMSNQAEVYLDGVMQNERGKELAWADIEDGLQRVRIQALGRVPEMLGVVGRADMYHPMQDWIVATPWDGTDRLGALAESVPTDSKLWPVYLRKWLIQAIEAVRGWEDGVQRSLPHVLVFVGGQGAGKGRWLRSLAPDYVLPDAELHLNSAMEKDALLHALKHPIVELGEIEATFRKADTDSLKSFLSRPDDSIRAPYERRAVYRPRMTVFAGSVNSTEFLRDQTGSRRFWPVQLRPGEKLDWDHGIDMQQVFAQANELWCEGEDWNLDEAIEDARAEEAHEFTTLSATVERVDGHWREYHGEYDKYAILNKTRIIDLVGGSTHPAEMSAVAAWLQANLGPSRKIKGYQRSWVFPVGHVRGITWDGEFLSETEAKEYVMAQKRAP